MKTFEKKTWLIPSSSPEIKEYEQHIATFTEHNGFAFSVPPDVVDEGNVFMAQNLVCILEHYPEAIESLLFGMDFKFEVVEGIKLYVSEAEWKGEKKYIKWFAKMGDVFIMPFFIRDHEARFHCMAGKMIAKGEIKITGFDKPRQKFTFEGKGLRLLMNNMWEACVLMMVYTTGAPFNVVPYIDVFITEYNTTFTLEQVIAEYERRMEAGFEYQARNNKAK